MNENALAKAFFRSYLQPEEVVCEWEILGRADQEVFVQAYCAAIYSAGPSQAHIPTVIHIGTDGSVESAEIPGSGSAYGAGIQRMFPPELQEVIFGRIALPYSQQRADRLRWRRGHPDEPPWIVFSLSPIQPTQPVIPFIMPDSIQVARWKEYQTALAKIFLSYLPPEAGMCEWEILGQTDQEVYVWTICTEAMGVGSLEGLAVIYRGADGSVLNAATTGIGGIGFPSDNRQMFPLDVQQRYFGGLIHYQELVDHLRWKRQGHQDEPPLIVLRATPAP